MDLRGNRDKRATTYNFLTAVYRSLSLLAAVLDSEEQGLVDVEDNAGLTCVSRFTHIYCVGDTGYKAGPRVRVLPAALHCLSAPPPCPIPWTDISSGVILSHFHSLPRTSLAILLLVPSVQSVGRSRTPALAAKRLARNVTMPVHVYAAFDMAAQTAVSALCAKNARRASNEVPTRNAMPKLSFS